MKLKLSEDAKTFTLGLLISFAHNSNQGRLIRRAAMKTATKFTSNSTKPNVKPKERAFIMHLMNMALVVLAEREKSLPDDEKKEQELERINKDRVLAREVLAQVEGGSK